MNQAALALPRATDARLLVAALSLTGSGVVFRAWADVSLPGILLVAWTGALLTFVVYRFNRVTDGLEAAGGGTLPRAYRGELVGSFALVALSLAALAPAARLAGLVILGVGLGYSMRFGPGPIRWRPKNVYLLKNTLIGLGWALLPVIGANGAPVPIALTVFVGIQIFIGSTVRDIADLDEDRREGARTLPVVHGVDRTLDWLELSNLACVPAVLLLAWSENGALAIGLCLPVAWRFGVLRLIRCRRTIGLLQGATLATCHLILLGALVGHCVLP
jgi:hypothetical protein